MKRTIILLTALIISTPLFAATTATSNLAVSASVAANCTISTSPVAFGAYDPLGANSTTPAGDLAGAGSVTVTCTKGNGATVDLGSGLYAVGSVRNMSDATDVLAYELYTDALHTTVWGSGVGTNTIGGATSKAPRVVPVYGLVKGNQYVGAGSYVDTVVATVNY
jgi:spore coat protein U-like protein